MIKLSKRTTQIIVGVIFIFLAFFIILPFTLDGSSLKAQLEVVISKKLQADFKSKGKLEVSFLPLPKLFLNDVTISKLKTDEHYYSDITIKSIAIRPNFFSLFSSKPVIAKIIFDSPIIDNKYLKSDEKKPEDKTISAMNIPSSGGALAKIFNFGNGGEETFDTQNIKTIEVKGGAFTRHNIDNETALEFSHIGFFLTNKSQVFDVSGGFISDGEPTNFELIANAKDGEESSIKISSAILSLSVKGKFSNSNINNLAQSNFVGKVDAKIIDLKSFLGKYIAKNSTLYRKINSSQPIKISADIENKGGEITANNITIESDLMKAKGIINANIALTKPKMSADFEFNNIDIDAIWFVGGVNSGSNTVALENNIIKKFLVSSPQNQNIAPISNDENKTYLLPNDEKQVETPPIIKPIFDNLDLSAKIKVKTARYYGQDLQNISFDFASDQNNLLLKDMVAETPGGGTIKINGTMLNENDIPEFVGKIEASGKNLQKLLNWMGIDLQNLKPEILNEYTVGADLLLLPSFNVLNNLNLNINGGKNIVSGNIKIDDSAGISKMQADLKMNYLNYEDYFISDKTNTYLSSGSLLKKLLWLNSVTSSRDIAFSFDNLIYDGNSFANQGFKIKVGQGNLKIYDVNFSSDKIDLKGSVEVDITKSPILNISIQSNNLQYKNKTETQKNKNLLDQFLNLPAIDEFDGAIDLNIKDLNVDGWTASSIAISGPIKSGIIDFDNFTLKSHKGDIKYKGSVIIKGTKTVNGSLEFIGVDAGGVLNDLLNIKNISGVSNISAIVNSTAEDKAEFLKNLDARGQFIGQDIAVKGFGIYDLAVKLARSKKFTEELRNPDGILYGSDTTSVLNNVSGAFAIKKGNKDQFSIKTSNSGINGVVSGEFDVENQNLDGAANFIFISGTRQFQVPINIATAFKGKSGSLQRSNNFTQIEEYLRRTLGSNQQPTNPATGTPTTNIPGANIPVTNLPPINSQPNKQTTN